MGKREALPGELSRGMKQKLLIACGLLHRPKALLLDEPLTGLDPVGIRRMKAYDRRTGRGRRRGDLELAPAASGRGGLYQSADHESRPCAGPRLDFRDSLGEAGDGRADARGGVRGDRRCRWLGRSMIDALTYLASRSIQNRLSRQIRRLRTPRYFIAIVLGLFYLYAIIEQQRSARDGASPESARWVDLVVTIGVACAAAWAWIFGSERRVLAFSPADVTFLFPGPGDPTRARLLQAAPCPARGALQHLAVDVAPDARAVRGIPLASCAFALGTPHDALHASHRRLVRTQQPSSSMARRGFDSE